MKRYYLLLMATLLVLAMVPTYAATVAAPPDAPSWWNSEDAVYWAYYNSAQEQQQSNFNGFQVVLNSIGGNSYEFGASNVANPNLVKKFGFFVDADFTVDGVQANGTPIYTWTKVGKWVFGTASPQPSYLQMYFTVNGDGAIASRGFGEMCTPEPGSLLALGGGLLSLAGMALRRRR